MSDQTPDADEQNLIVNQLIADFISRRNAGEQLSIEEFVAEHPEHTDELKRQFANDSALKAFKEPDKTDVAETIVGSGNAGGISAEDATAQTVVGGSDTSVTQSHQQRNTGSTTSIEIPENFGRYAIQKVLGQGAMGAVYLAKDTQLDRDVALKIPKFGDENGVDDEELLARFYREARASATIRSLNICPVYDVGEIDGQHYITMAFIKGRPLKDYTQSKKSHPEKQIISTIRKLASGLAEAHKIGVVHRDLKPANIMVDENGEPVVMDFGLARRSSSDDVQVTQSGAILGTPAYMSPEQIEGDQSVIGPQTDIYALGVIMYELITGEMPFKGSLITLISQIAANNPAKPSKLRKNIDPRLETICLKMMESDLGQRYQSMTEVADDLQDVLRNPGKQQTKEQAKKKGPKPTSLPSAGEESNPALISIEQPKSYAEQLRERKGKRSRKKSKVTSKTKSKSKATAKSGSRSSGPSKNLLIAGGVGGLLLLLGIFYVVRGGNHDVQITSDDPDIKQSVAVLKESSGNGHDGKITGAKRVGASGAAFATQGGVELTRGLVGHWNFEENKGTQVADSSGNGNHGTLLDIDAKVWSDETPPSGLAGQHSLRFNKNTKNRIEIPNSDSLDIRDQITVAFWAKVSNVSGTVLSKEYDRVFKISGSADGWRWQIAMFPDVRGSENSHDFITRPRDLPGKWTHLVARYDGREICWFINGTRQSQEPYTRPLQTYGNPLFLGNEKEGNAPIDGHLDDVRIYNRALNEAEIEVLSGKANPKKGHLPTNDTNTPPLAITPFNTTHALQFANAKDVVTLANKGTALTDLLTVEMWVASEIPPVSKMERRHLTSVGIEHGLINLDLRYNFNQVAQTSLIADVQGQTNLWTTETIRAGKYAEHGWMHIAYTWTGHKMQIYLNGQGQEDMHRSGGDEGKRLADTVLATLGGKSSLGQPFQGRIRELRISKSVRYQKNFEVTSPDVPFTADANTLALYHFDEGTGDVLKDSSGNGNDGKIVGAKWVEVGNDTSQPIDLLADLVPTAMNSKDLNWQMKDGVLSCSSTSSSATKKKKWVGATFPQKISGDADFDLELKQMGFAPLQIDLPLGDKQAIRLHLGGLGCALMEIDGKGDRDVDPEYRNTDVKLKRNVWQRLTAQVRHHGENIDVDVALDGIRIGRFSGLRSRITLPSWIKPDPVHVKFAGNGDLSAIQLEFRRVLVTPISSVASPSGNRSDGEAIAATPPLAVAPFDAIQARQHQQAWADYLGLPVEKKVTLPGGQKMTFMLIPPGEFMMGSTEEERSQIIKEHSSFPAFKGILAAEGPQHRVQISRPFYLGKYEVIQSQWLAVMGINPPGKQSQGSSSHPAESISWNETQAFFKKFNQGSCPATMRGMLPTEAQWEYACRAGTSTSWSFGDREADVKNHAWFDANSNSQTQPVGKLPPNHFGLHDMHGNVGEWCFDSPSSSFYGQSKLRDPVAGDLNSPKHIYRGGNVYLNPVWCRSAFRANQSSDTKKMRLGFRATMEIDVTKLKEKTTATTQNPVKSPSDGESTSVSLLEMLTSSEYKWTTPVNLGPQINSDQGDNHPTASGDGLILMFESDRDLNTIRLFECSRSSIDEPWSTPRAIDELNRIMATDPKLSHDGLSLLFISPRGGKKQDLFLSRRSKRDAPWQDPVNLGPEVNSSELQGGGGFSPDGLTVYFKRPKKGNTTLKFSDMWRAQRSAVDVPWEKAASLGPEINLDDGGGTAEVQPLADGKSLLFTHNKRLFLAQRDDTGKFQVRKLETKTLFYNFTLTDNGTLLFTSQMQGGIGKGDLWMSRRVRKD